MLGFAIIALAIVLYFLIARGKIKLPRFVPVLILLVGLGFVIWDNFRFVFADKADTETDPTYVNSCGCQSGHLAVLRTKKLFKTTSSAVPCSVALEKVNKDPGKYSIVGCTAGNS